MSRIEASEVRSRRRRWRTAAAVLFAAVLSSEAGMAAAPADATTPASSSPARTNGPPNIVLILADDLGIETINAYGGQYATPRIDQLARDGVMFRNAHATPLCTPSRTRIMTGRENAKNYEAFGYLNPKERTFGNVLKDAGYVTGIVGKWQLVSNGYDGRQGMMPAQAGFDEALLWQVKALDSAGSRYWGPTLWSNGRNRVNESGFGPDLMQAFALDFIAKHRAQPFFLYYPMVLTHSPFVPTPDSATATDVQARFAGMVTYMDRQVGELMDRLVTLGLDRNTVVIFTGDNGTGQAITSWRNGAKVPGGKGTPTLRGTQVPMIVRWPGHAPPGAARDGLFDFTDVLPTLAEIAGARIDASSIDGRSQVAVIEGRQPKARDWIFMHYAPGWLFEPTRFIFDEKWKVYEGGRFVALDPEHGIETEVPEPTGVAARRRDELTRLLKSLSTRPLDPLRFPMCVGKTSKDPRQPPEIAGCDLGGGAVD